MREIMVSLVYIAYFALIYLLYIEIQSFWVVIAMLLFIPSFKFKNKTKNVDNDKKIF